MHGAESTRNIEGRPLLTFQSLLLGVLGLSLAGGAVLAPRRSQTSVAETAAASRAMTWTRALCRSWISRRVSSTAFHGEGVGYTHRHMRASCSPGFQMTSATPQLGNSNLRNASSGRPIAVASRACRRRISRCVRCSCTGRLDIAAYQTGLGPDEYTQGLIRTEQCSMLSA